MGFFNHCEGQRFDRARVLRALRATRRRLREPEAAGTAEQAITMVIEAVRALDVPHLESLEDWGDDEIVH